MLPKYKDSMECCYSSADRQRWENLNEMALSKAWRNAIWCQNKFSCAKNQMRYEQVVTHIKLETWDAEHVEVAKRKPKTHRKGESEWIEAFG